MADTAVVGPSLQVSGTTSNLRSTADGALVVADSQGVYVEAALRGKIYHAMTTSAGVSIASLTFGTAVPFSLYNPFGSGYYLAVLRLGMVVVSGTVGAGQLFWVANTNPNAAAVTGTAITVIPGNVGGSVNNVGKPLTTATLPAAPVACGAVATCNPLVAGTTALAPNLVDLSYAGLFLIAPGCSLSVGGVTAAGSSPLVQFACAWMEISSTVI